MTGNNMGGGGVETYTTTRLGIQIHKTFHSSTIRKAVTLRRTSGGFISNCMNWLGARVGGWVGGWGVGSRGTLLGEPSPPG